MSLGFFPSTFLIPDTDISQVKGIVRTEEKNLFDLQTTLHAFFTPFCWLSKGLFIWYRNDFHSGMSFVPESASSSRASFFAQRWARNASNTRVTVDEAQGTKGKRKMRGDNFIERERVWLPDSSRVKFLLSTQPKARGSDTHAPLSPDDKHVWRFSMRNKVRFQLTWY